MTTLLAVPNVSEGRDEARITKIAEAFGPGLLDVHRDPDHHRSVFTVAGAPGALAATVDHGVRLALQSLDISRHQGIHPRIGAIDVAPIVFLNDSDRGAACAEALVLADLLGQQEIPVFLYGLLAGGRSRAELRRGGPEALAARTDQGELAPDFGPRHLHETAGAVLVAARPPLIAFNLELAPPATAETARRIAAAIREGGPEGLPGVRAIGLWLEHREVAQVSVNVEDHRAVPLISVLQAVTHDAAVSGTELVGLAPSAAFEGFPAGVPVRNRRVLEDVLGPASGGLKST